MGCNISSAFLYEKAHGIYVSLSLHPAQNWQGLGICERWIKQINEGVLFWNQFLTLEDDNIFNQHALNM
jgi:hypothetical protein